MTEPTPERLDAEGISRSLTGFDEIAIERMFGQSIATLSGTIQARSLLFIAKRREGMKDRDAWKTVMDMPIGEVETYFDMTTDEAEVADAGK